MKKVSYVVPEIEVLNVTVESGFATSPRGDANPDYPTETPNVPNEDTDW